LIDPWKEYSGEGAGSLSKLNQKDWDAIYQECVDLKKRYPWIRLIRKTAKEAAKGFFDKEAGLVFIDGCHDYVNCFSDIKVWREKVWSHGGILAGHDYGAAYPGVKKAVDELIPDATITSSGIWYNIIGEKLK